MHFFVFNVAGNSQVEEETGLSNAEKTSIIVVCVLVGVALLVGLGIFMVVRHTKKMYKTMAKRHSQVSLQSRLDSERAKVVVDNRRSNRRNSRTERRVSMQKLSVSKQPSGHLLSAREGDVMFVSASSTRQDLDVDFTDNSAASLLDNQVDSGDYAPIGPGKGSAGPELPARNMTGLTPVKKSAQKKAREMLATSSSEQLSTDGEISSDSSHRRRLSVDSMETDDGQTTDYEDQP